MKLALVVVLATAIAVPSAIVLVDGGAGTMAQEGRDPRGAPAAESPAADVRLAPPAAGGTRRVIDETAFLPRTKNHLPRYRNIPQLVADLRDDDVRWNATTAATQIARQARANVDLRREIRTTLEGHVDSPDDQLRVIASSLLVEIDLLEIQDGRRAGVSGELLDRVVEWLATPPKLESRFFGTLSFRRTVLFAMEHIDEIEERLVHAITRPGGRDVFLHAFVLGATGRNRFTDLVAPVLLPHLRDNHESPDACMAMEALVGLGPDVLSHLDTARTSADEQQRGAIDAIVLELTDPTLTLEQAIARKGVTDVSDKYHAPARSWRFRTSYRWVDRTEGF